MNIYHLDPQTGELLWVGQADESPREPGVYLIPAYATHIAPPPPVDGFVRRFADGAWGYSPDAEPERPIEAAPVITATMVNVERDRRIAAGATFTIAGYGDIPITGRERDQIVLATMLQRAQALKAADNTAASLVLRDAGNITHQLTPDQAIDLVSQGIAWIEATMQVSWNMKDGVGAFADGIPADYSDDRHWP